MHETELVRGLAELIARKIETALVALDGVQEEQVLQVLACVHHHSITPRRALQLIDERILTGTFKDEDLPEPEPVEPILPAACAWTQIDLDEWATACGRKYRRCAQCLPEDPGFADLGVQYCCYCGKPAQCAR